MSTGHVTVGAAGLDAAKRERIVGGAVTRTRIAAALGLLSIILTFVGLSVHGYPPMVASSAEIAQWATTTNQQQFAIGIYVEALGYMLFLLFAAWLWSVAREAEGGSGWLSTAGFGTAVLYVAGIITNGIWSALLDAGHQGASPQMLVVIYDIAQDVFQSTILFGAVFSLLIGYVLFRTRALPRWIGATAVVVGLLMLIPPTQQIGALVLLIWTVAVSLYLLVRPGAVATVREPSAAVVA